MRYRNATAEHRTWPTLTDAATGTTLELDPGAEADVVEPVTDPRLKPVRPPAAARSKPKPEPSEEN